MANMGRLICGRRKRSTKAVRDGEVLHGKLWTCLLKLHQLVVQVLIDGMLSLAAQDVVPISSPLGMAAAERHGVLNVLRVSDLATNPPCIQPLDLGCFAAWNG